MKKSKFTTWASALLALALILPMGACGFADELLSVDNPEEIPIDALNDPTLVSVMVAGVIGDFREMYDDPFIWRASMLTDEQVTGINWEGTARLNQRLVRYDEGDADLMFSNISRAYRQAVDVRDRLEGGLVANPGSNKDIALTEAYAGYSLIMMGEAMCQAVIGTADNLGTTILSPNDLFQQATTHLGRALTVANAAGRADLENLARVGLARAHLSLSNFGDVITHASAVVDPTFVYNVEYSSNSTSEELVLFSRVTGSNHSLGVHPAFLNGTFGDLGIVAGQTDPRIQHTEDWSLGHNRLTLLYKPFQSLRFSGYNGETIANGGTPILYEEGTDIVLGDYLEAQHHMFEAMMRSGGDEAQILQFVNDRRAFGNEGAVTLSGDALFAELRRQRSRDFYMGGLRIGDLRRWARDGVGNFFPTGTHPNTQWGDYGVWTCFPIPLEEYEGNPGLQKPANPLDPPGI